MASRFAGYMPVARDVQIAVAHSLDGCPFYESMKRQFEQKAELDFWGQ